MRHCRFPYLHPHRTSAAGRPFRSASADSDGSNSRRSKPSLRPPTALRCGWERARDILKSMNCMRCDVDFIQRRQRCAWRYAVIFVALSCMFNDYVRAVLHMCRDRADNLRCALMSCGGMYGMLTHICDMA